MPSQQRLNELPDVESQTELDSVIKLDWNQSQKSRARIWEHGACAHVSDARHDNEPDWRGVSYRCYEREKTNVVIKTEEEARELLMDLHHEYEIGASTANSRTGSVSQTPMMNKKYGKMYRALKQKLEAQGLSEEYLTDEY